MNTELENPSISAEASSLVGIPSLTTGVVSSTPDNHIDSSTFLQEQVFTGIQVDVPLPFGAVNGFVPMFAVRVQPNMMTPYLLSDDDSINAFINKASDVNYADRVNAVERMRMPVRPFNGSTFKYTGPEPPHSIFSNMYRFNRISFVYTLRLVSTYTGGGIIMVVPAKGIPRGNSPVSVSSAAQLLANGMTINSNVQCDLSKSRQMRFLYPYEYPTEYQDIMEDFYFPDPVSDDSMYRGHQTMFDNWFVVGTRSSVITPTNADKLTFFIDYAFADHHLTAPLLPSWRATMPSIPLLKNKQYTMYAEFSESDFDDTRAVKAVPDVPIRIRIENLSGKEKYINIRGGITRLINNSMVDFNWEDGGVGLTIETENDPSIFINPSVYNKTSIVLARVGYSTFKYLGNNFAISTDPSKPTIWPDREGTLTITG